MSDLLKITVGVIGLDAEVNNEIAKIESKIPIALNAVGSEMILSLKRHIQEDFYNKYTPVAYRRRYDDGLLNEENIDAETYGKRTLQFTYNPQGLPMGKLKDSLNWSEDLEEYLKSVHKTGETPFFSSARNGDDLIVWGQTAHDIGTKHIPARPFWNNFVEEQFNGKIMQTFIQAFAGTPYSVVLDGNDLQTDGNESMLEAGNTQLKF